ncbi:MAG: MarR family transcriptional regulator [Acidimicrobiales bacterium]
MTLPQLRVLLLVARAPERASHLASQAAVSRPALTGVLDGLVEHGWVRRREVAGDRRGVQLELTAAGGRALAEAQRSVADRCDDLLARLPADRRAAAVDGLVALGEAIDLELAHRRDEADAGRTAR